MRSPHRCPNCGEPVSGFAAGCALCGAELDPRRAQGPRTLSERVRSAAHALSPRARVREKSPRGAQVADLEPGRGAADI